MDKLISTPLNIIITSFIVSAVLTGIAVILLRRAAILDLPNHRSSHDIPVPRGGGIAVMATIFLMIGLLIIKSGVRLELMHIAALAGAVLLTLTGWLDDLKNLSPLVRLGVQLAVAGLSLFTLPHEWLVFNGLLPLMPDRAIAVIGLVWFMNLYNFMDGIDGITTIETSFIMLGLMALGVLMVPGIILGAAAGFLLWNWHRARIFLGDVGSVPLGFITGWFLIVAACHSAWPAVIILPLYYLMDATITLACRLMRGEKVWQAHRDHFYQQAIKAGWRHDQVSLTIMGINILLLWLAIESETLGWLAFVAAFFAVSALLLGWHLSLKRSVSASG